MQTQQFETEAQFMQSWGGFVATLARDVREPAALGMDQEDVHADLQITLLEAARTHLESDGFWPRPGLVKTILRRRVMVLNRNSRAAGRDTDRMPVSTSGEQDRTVPLVERICAPDDTEEETVQAQTRRACLALLVHLKAVMRPRDYALLYVRFVEELGPAAIAAAVSSEQRKLGARLLRARRTAQTHLTERGIWSWQDVEEGAR